jgi:hypothetical protein
MKKVIVSLLVLVFLLALAVSGFAADPIKVNINGYLLNSDVPAQNINGRVLVPVRAIFEALGATVEFDSVTSTVIGKKGNITVQLPINSKIATKNGQRMNLDVPATIIEGRTMVPARFIAESLGEEVNWDGSLNTVIIGSLKPQIDSNDQPTNTANQFKIRKNGTELDGFKNYGGSFDRGQDSLKLIVTDGNAPMALAADSNNNLVKSASFGVYEAELKFETEKGDAGFVFHVANPKAGVENFQGYYVGIGVEKNEVFVGKTNPKWQRIKSSNLPYDVKTNQYYRLKLVIYAGQIDIYVNDVKYISASDDTYGSGGYFGPRTRLTSTTFRYMSHNMQMGNLEPSYNGAEPDYGKFQTLKYKDGSVYEGILQDNRPHGFGVMYYANGDRYTGEFRLGSKSGYGIQEWASGDRYEGQFDSAGRMFGQGTYYFRDGNKYIGDWRVPGHRVGHGIFYWSNGDKYAGEFDYGRLHGYGKMTWASGQVYEGQFVDGKRAQ